MLMTTVLLDYGILLVGWTHLKFKNMIFDGCEGIRIFRFGFAPFSQVFGKEKGFDMKRLVGGFVPAAFGDTFIVIIKEPPVFKLERLVIIATLAIENRFLVHGRFSTLEGDKTVVVGKAEHQSALPRNLSKRS
jgi:hypothetical protein